MMLNPITMAQIAVLRRREAEAIARARRVR